MDRVGVLAARVKWLDRYRRAVAIIAAAIIAPLTIAQFAKLVGADWPAVHGVALSVIVGLLAWWVVEVGLALATAIWETEWAGLARERGLPRAIVLRRR